MGGRKDPLQQMVENNSLVVVPKSYMELEEFNSHGIPVCFLISLTAFGHCTPNRFHHQFEQSQPVHPPSHYH